MSGFFDERIGLPKDTGSAMYSLKIALRSFFVVLTGFLFFPFILLLTGKDTLGRWLGAELVKKLNGSHLFLRIETR